MAEAGSHFHKTQQEYFARFPSGCPLDNDISAGQCAGPAAAAGTKDAGGNVVTCDVNGAVIEPREDADQETIGWSSTLRFYRFVILGRAISCKCGHHGRVAASAWNAPRAPLGAHCNFYGLVSRECLRCFMAVIDSCSATTLRQQFSGKPAVMSSDVSAEKYHFWWRSENRAGARKYTRWFKTAARNGGEHFLHLGGFKLNEQCRRLRDEEGKPKIGNSTQTSLKVQYSTKLFSAVNKVK